MKKLSLKEKYLYFLKVNKRKTNRHMILACIISLALFISITPISSNRFLINSDETKEAFANAQKNVPNNVIGTDNKGMLIAMNTEKITEIKMPIDAQQNPSSVITSTTTDDIKEEKKIANPSTISKTRKANVNKSIKAVESNSEPITQDVNIENKVQENKSVIAAPEPDVNNTNISETNDSKTGENEVQEIVSKENTISTEESTVNNADNKNNQIVLMNTTETTENQDMTKEAENTTNTKEQQVIKLIEQTYNSPEELIDALENFEKGYLE